MSSRDTCVLWVAHPQAHHRAPDQAQTQAQTHGPVRSAFAKTHDLTVTRTRTALLRQFASRPRVIILDGGPAPTMVLAALWARARRIPAIIWQDERLEDESWLAGGVLRRWYYRNAALVLTSSPWITEASLHLGVPRSHIVEGLSADDIDLFIGSRARAAAHPEPSSATARGTVRSAEVR